MSASASDVCPPSGSSPPPNAKPRSGSELSSSPMTGSPHLARARRDSLLASLDDNQKAALLQELPEESKEALRKKSEKLLKKELEKKLKSEERNSKKLKKKEQDEAKQARKFQIPIDEVQRMINSFRCAYHKTGIIHHGKLYVFPSFLCFTSSSGLTTAKVAISEIKSITLKVINAIQIITTPPDCPKGKKYYFSHWHHRERAFKSFNALWRIAQGDTSISLEDLKDAEKVKTLVFPDDGRSGSGNLLSNSMMSLESSADDISAVEDSHSDFEPTMNYTSTPAQTTEEESIVLPPLLDKIQYVPPHAAKSPDASAVLEVSLKQFWKLFFADSKFYSDVHYAKGDKVARTGEWTVSEGGFYVRPHYFEQEIKSKLMRGKICKVDQTQQACLVNDKQFLFGTDSRMEGVPLASDFTVKTYWEVCEEQPRLVNIHVWLWVDWIKVPFGLKGTIERGSINGVKEHFESFISDAKALLAAQNLGGGSPREGGESAQFASTSEPGNPAKADQQPTTSGAAAPATTTTVQTTTTTLVRENPRPPSSSTSAEKGLTDSLLKDPIRMLGLGVLLVALLVLFTYFFLCNPRSAAGDADLLRAMPPVAADEATQLLAARWQADLDAIHTHLREAHALMEKLQQQVKSYARQQ